MIALINNGPGVGDKIQFASIPEIIYHNTQEKILDVNSCWIWDHNPYVVRDKSIVDYYSIDLWQLSHNYIQDEYLSTSERFFKNSPFKHFEINIRHPRLFRFEDNKIQPNRITIHTTGASEGGSINSEILDHIAKTYHGFEIIQIGGPNDKRGNFINMLGLDIWSTAELISSSTIFIGVDSGAGMGIANCYPRVNRKIILNRRDIDTFFPLNRNTGWLDFNVQYFNQTKKDVGTTYSYLKI